MTFGIIGLLVIAGVCLWAHHQEAPQREERRRFAELQELDHTRKQREGRYD